VRKVLLTTAALVALTTPALPRDPIWDQLASKIKISSQQMNQVNAIPKNKYDPAGPDAQGILQTAPVNCWKLEPRSWRTNGGGMRF
jgi:hypothetical protein